VRLRRGLFYRRTVIEIVRPDPALHADFVEVMDEFEAAGEHPHGSGVVPEQQPDDGVTRPLWRAATLRDVQAFMVFCDDMRRRADREYADDLGLAPDHRLWLVEDLRLLGFLSVRLDLDVELLERVGHVAYAVRPSARHHGVGTAACAHALGLLRAHGLRRALITCEEANLASAATIVRNGGRLDGVREGRRRYWVDLTG
jgi:predicted acetyltransferase